jgi:hypothetical protein
LVKKTGGKILIGGSRSLLDNNIEANLKKGCCTSKNVAQWRAFFNTLLNLPFPLKVENVLIREIAICSLFMSLFNSVSVVVEGPAGKLDVFTAILI